MARRTFARSRRHVMEHGQRAKVHEASKGGSRARRTTFGPGLGDGDLYGPGFPAHLLVSAREPGFATPLLEELDGELAPGAAAAAVAEGVGVAVGGGGGGSGGAAGSGGSLGVELALEGRGTLVDHGLELVVVDVGEGQVEDVAGARGEGGEKAGEEDCVEDSWKSWPRVSQGPFVAQAHVIVDDSATLGRHGAAVAGERGRGRGGRRKNSPLTTSRTERGSLKTSRMNSGGSCCFSIVDGMLGAFTASSFKARRESGGGSKGNG